MAASVQGWKKKWFYIKDQKISSSDHYDIAPFDANQDLKKLSSWDHSFKNRTGDRTGEVISSGFYRSDHWFIGSLSGFLNIYKYIFTYN
jgi:hypothetical protein